MSTQIDLLKKYDLRVRGHLGQHLLIDPNLQRKIIDLLELGPDEPVLEIGPGLGALTGEMLGRGARVLAVEIDSRFAEILKKEWAAAGDRLEVVREDFLQFDAARLGKRKWKVASNLPYYISAPILFRLLECRRNFSRAVLMLQKEVAERLVAPPGTKHYGRLSLGVRYAADVTHAFDIPPSCFTPRPEVDSSVVVVNFHARAHALGAAEEEFLFHLITVAFSQRRKTLFHLLVRDEALDLSKETLKKIFEELFPQPKVRGEELLLKDFMTLGERLAPYRKKPKKPAAGARRK